MKKPLLLFLIIITATLCSCSSNFSNDVYFVHTLCFDKNQEDDTVTLYAVCEKQSGDTKSSDNSKSFFVAQETADSIDKASDKLTKKYKDCYLASSELYLIWKNTPKEFLNELSYFICDSSVFSSKGRAVCIETESIDDFLGAIKEQEDIKRILKLTESDKTNIISFLSKYQNKPQGSSISSLSLSKGKIVTSDQKKFTFKNNELEGEKP